MIKNTLLLFIGATLLLFSTIQAQEYTISGYVSDDSSLEKLISANVFDGDTYVGTTTNNFGFYSLTLPAGKIKLQVSYIGYEDFIIDIDLNGNVTQNITLKVTNQLDEVQIVATTQKNIAEESNMSTIEVPIKQIKKVPALLGEVDIIKALQLLPGVQSGSEGQTGLYVRGGSPDQNLILLDGVPVYNVNHLFGFFSVFNADAIKDVKLIKGGFPARYGGRLSSVLEINMKEGNMKEFHGAGSIGLVASKLTLEGPIKTDTTSFIVSGRRTYIDVLARPIIRQSFGEGTEGDAGYFFYDLNAKINHKFSDRDRLFFSVYGGRDRFFFNINEDNLNFRDFGESSLGWGNITSALRWNHLWTPKLFSNTSLTYTRYELGVGFLAGTEDLELQQTEEFGLNYNSGVADISAKIDFDYYLSPNHFIKTGLALIHHSFVPGEFDVTLRIPDGFTDIDTTIGQDNIFSQEINVYIEDDATLTDQLKVNAGLHFSSFFVNDVTYTSLQPRISARYLLNENQSIKASFATMTQFINLLSNEGIGLPTDIWVPSTENILPQQAWQAAAGYAFKLTKDLDMTIEGFYKQSRNLVSFAEGEGFFDNSFRDFDERVIQGDGEAFGLELFVQKKTGRFTGWIGYTWSKAFRQFEELNKGEKFPFTFDRRHDISLVGLYEISDRVNVSATWVYGTGNAVTLPSNTFRTFVRDGDSQIPIEVNNFEERNGFRMAPFHRLDVGINFSKQKRKHRRTWSFGAYNTYNRKNPFFIDIDRVRTVDDQGNVFTERQLRQRSLIPIIPYFNYSFTF